MNLALFRRLLLLKHQLQDQSHLDGLPLDLPYPHYYTANPISRAFTMHLLERRMDVRHVLATALLQSQHPNHGPIVEYYEHGPRQLAPLLQEPH